MGAEGLMLPMVGSPEEARQILDGLKYVPDGRRGVALGIAHDRYMPGPTMEKLAAANRRTTLFAQIETRQGVENADALAALDGVDCLWIGHFDLSCSLGIPGQFEHADFKAAVDTVARACRKHRKALGRLVPTVEEAVAYRALGFDFLCYSGDVWALQGAVQAGLDEIRARTAGSAAAKGKSKSKTTKKSKK
jgi:2-keto-3-deoxy-L-rhamnonate aldolase RhmA